MTLMAKGVRFAAVAFFSINLLVLAVGTLLPYFRATDALPAETTAQAAAYGAFFAAGLLLLSGRAQSFAPMMGLAIFLRLAFICLTTVPFTTGDAGAFVEIANNIAHGRGALLIAPSGPPLVALYPPLYPCALSIPIFLGLGQQVAIVTVNFAADLFTAFGLRYIAEECRVDGRCIPPLYLLWPPALTGAAIAYKECLGVAFVVGMLAVMFRWRRTRSFLDGSLFGAFGACLCLTVPNWVGVVIGTAVLVALAVGRRAAVRLIAQAAPLGIGILIIWWVRTWLLLGEPVLLTSGTGINLYFVVTNSYDQAIGLLNQYSELAANREAFGRAIKLIAEDPLHYLRSQLITLIRSWGLRGWHGGILIMNGETYVGGAVSRFIQFAALGQSAWILLLAMRGRLNQSVLAIGVTVLLSVVALDFWFELGERHLFVLAPFMLLLMFAAKPQRRSALLNLPAETAQRRSLPEATTKMQ